MSARTLKTLLAVSAFLAAAPVHGQGWQGPYVGVHMGGAAVDFTNSAGTTPGASGGTGGFVGGFQLGYNWQRGNSVIGAEADISLTDISDQFSTGQFEEELMTSLRLRAGIAHGETLVYGSLGVAWTEHETTLNGVGSSDDLEPGLIFGAGAERFLSENVAGRIEAYYVDAPSDIRNTAGTPTGNGSQNVIFRAGLSLHF